MMALTVIDIEKIATVADLLEALRPYVERMEAKGIDCTYMRGKIAGLEIALEIQAASE